MVIFDYAKLHGRAEGLENMDFQTREVWCENDGQRIFGILRVPENASASAKVPLVVFSHELGTDHTSGDEYSRQLASHGIAFYAADYRGGTVGGNRSDGDNLHMTVFTEVSDLEAVLGMARTWDFVDAKRIILMGGSQGAMVTAFEAAKHPDDFPGIILMYPPFGYGKVMKKVHPTIDSVPEQVPLFDGWITVSRRYVTDLWDYDVMGEITKYKGPVLYMHGDMDHTVPLEDSQKLAPLYHDVDFRVVAGGHHIFRGEPQQIAIGYILDWMRAHGFVS